MKRKLNKRSLILLVSFVAVLTITVSSTLAYIAVKTGSLTNIFHPAAVSVELTQNGNDYTIKNVGNVDVYVRVAVVAKQDGQGEVELDTLVTQFTGDNWEKASDGFWYYTQMLASNAETTFTIAAGSAVQVHASAIQATPDAVTAWSRGVASVGNGGDLDVQ